FFFSTNSLPPISTLFPYTTLFRSRPLPFDGPVAPDKCSGQACRMLTLPIANVDGLSCTLSLWGPTSTRQETRGPRALTGARRERQTEISRSKASSRPVNTQCRLNSVLE